MSYPVTAVYAALLALLLIGLSARVSVLRRRGRVSLGHGDNPALERAIRVHGNFVEFVPLALILLLLLEAARPGAVWLHGFGLALLLGRLLHAWGLARVEGVSFGRFWGSALTWLMMVGAALLNLWLALGWMLLR